jgi:hypothetical protein
VFEERLYKSWNERGLLAPLSKSTSEAIESFQSQNRVKLPEEFRRYFTHINGMSTRGGHDVDERGFSFLPIQALRSVADFSASMGWKSTRPLGGETAFVFVDYLHWSWAYAFETLPIRAGEIYVLGFDHPILLAPSLSKFVEMYLSNDPRLYPSQ